MSESSAIRWARRERQTGSAAASKMRGKRPKLLEAERAWLMKRVAEKPDLTLVVLLTELRSKDNGKGKRVCLDTLWRFLKGCDLSFKKTIYAAEQDRPDIARRLYWWRKYQTRIEPSRLVFIDETWIKTNMTRLRGWFQKGKSLVTKVTAGRWTTIIFIAALRLDGMTAPFTIRGPVNRDSFEDYV